ncbi:MAG TPA: Rpn family recombination-promoting nuclease/putative transposase, partial [Thermoanaerobaculia bacterium]
RRFFSLPEMVVDLVRGFIPEDWVQHLDLANMRQMSDVIIGDHWDRRDADTVWCIGWKGPHQGKPPLYVVLVFEFLSQPDHWAAVRMMAYVALVYQRLIDNGVVGPKDELPLVVPIVLYNGDPAWEAPEELEKLIVDLPGLERYRPRFRYLALDVKRYPLSELERMPNRAAALFQLEQSRGPEEILRGLERLREVLSDRSDRLYGGLLAVVDGRLPRVAGAAGRGREDTNAGGLHGAGRQHPGMEEERTPRGTCGRRTDRRTDRHSQGRTDRHPQGRARGIAPSFGS